MFRYLVIISLSLTLFSCAGNQDSKSAEGKTYDQFIPEGYSLRDSASGDLNGDQYKDMLLVVNKPKEDSASTLETPAHRPLLILLGDAEGKYTLAARNDKTVFCNNCGGAMGDPYVDIIIKNSYFSVEHYGGSNSKWAYTVGFKYATEDSSWYLDKLNTINYTYGEDSLETKEKVETSADFGKVRFENYDIYKKDEKTEEAPKPAV